MHARLTRMLRGLIVLGSIVLGVVVFLAVLAWKPWDARLSAEAAALALEREMGGGRYSCERTEYGGTLQLDDVDYFCAEEDAYGRGFWIGTDSDGITGIQPSG